MQPHVDTWGDPKMESSTQGCYGSLTTASQLLWGAGLALVQGEGLGRHPAGGLAYSNLRLQTHCPGDPRVPY